MNNVTLFWQAFLTRPLWVHVVVQLGLIGVGAVLGYYGFIDAERVLAANLGQRRDDLAEETAQIAQRLHALPTLSALTRQLASLESSSVTIGNGGVATLLASPLAQSGATLVSLQNKNHPVTSDGNKLRTAALPSGWLLLVSTDYHNALTFLHQMTALPQPLRIDSLTISSKNEGLLAEITLSLPLPTEGDRA